MVLQCSNDKLKICNSIPGTGPGSDDFTQILCLPSHGSIDRAIRLKRKSKPHRLARALETNTIRCSESNASGTQTLLILGRTHR